LLHVVPSTQVPVASHDSGMSPLHCLPPGEQTPVQAPEEHTYVQAAALDH
jgi:hypothetical protein